MRDALGQSVTLSGYALYIACARRLITIGIIEVATRGAPPRPSIPSYDGFEATPIYNAPGGARSEHIELTTAVPLRLHLHPAPPAIAASFPTRFNIRASNLRVIQAGVMWPSEPYGVLALWEAVYGTYPPGGTITS